MDGAGGGIVIPPEEHCGVYRVPGRTASLVADARQSALLAAAAVCEERAALLMARALDAQVTLVADDMYRVSYAAAQLNDVAHLLKEIAGMVVPLEGDR